MFTFPYENKRITEGILVDPRVTIPVETTRGIIRIKFLVDSGADVTTFPIRPYASLFGVSRDPKTRVTIGGVEGRGVSAYPHTVAFWMGKRKLSARTYFIESLIDPLLGRLDVWNLFSIHFDNKKQQTIFTPLGDETAERK